MRIDFHRVDTAHQRPAFVDATEVVFVKISAGADIVGGEGDGHVHLGFTAAHCRRTAFGVFPLVHRQTQAIAQKRLHQHDHLTAIGCPHPGFAQGQGHMVVVTAFAAAYTGKCCIHRAFVRVTGHEAATECRRKSRYRSKLCASQFALPAGRMESHSVTYAVLLFLLYRHNSVPCAPFMCFCGY
ncbi:hypothetical protein D3C79_835010 [compost metagenome]